MKPYIFLLLLSSFLVSSQTPVSKTLGEFSELKVYDLINVELIESTENKIEITSRIHGIYHNLKFTIMFQRR